MLSDDILVKVQTENVSLGRQLAKIFQSSVGFRLLGKDDPAAAELLILELRNGTEADFEAIHSVLSTGLVSEVFLTSQSTDPEILVRAMRSGAREFFPQPIQEAEVAQALERYRQRRASPRGDLRYRKNGKVLDVIGGKGGVGNTTIAVNLATSLALGHKDLSVALIDMNLFFGEIPLFLDFELTYHWGEIARNISRLDSTLLMSALHKHASGVFVLPSPSHMEGDFVATPEIMERLLRLMKTVFDVIVVDSGHVTDEVSLKILEMTDTVILTAILSLPCLTNVTRFLGLFSDLGYPPAESVKIVINRYIKGSDISLRDAESTIGKEVFWTIPNDFRLTMSAINQGKVLSAIAARSAVTKSIQGLAETFVETPEDQRKRASLFGRLFGR